MAAACAWILPTGGFAFAHANHRGLLDATSLGIFCNDTVMSHRRWRPFGRLRRLLGMRLVVVLADHPGARSCQIGDGVAQGSSAKVSVDADQGYHQGTLTLALLRRQVHLYAYPPLWRI